MGRPGKRQSDLPPCYGQKHGAYFHVKKNVWRRVGATLEDVAADYAKQVAPASGVERLLDPRIDGVFKRMKNRKDEPLAPATVAAYEVAAEKLKHLLRQFSRPNQVKQSDAATVKVLLADTPVMANRVLTFGRLVWNDFLEQQVVHENPFIAVKRHRTAPRTRNYTWNEWRAIESHASPRLRLVMAGLYLTDQRIGDVLKIDERDLVEAGIRVKQKERARS